MNITTPPIDPAHPLAKLIQRSQKANKLPSCEGCRMGGKETASWDSKPFVFCELGTAPVSPIKLDDWRCGIEVVDFGHFCAAWEPKA